MNHNKTAWRGAIVLMVCAVIFTISVSGQRRSTLIRKSQPITVSSQTPLNPSSVVGRTPITGSGSFADLTNIPSAGWTASTPYPTTITRYAFADAGEVFYVLGGVSNGTRVPNVNRFNTSTHVWTPLAPIPVASEAPCATLDSGKIYLAEGDTGTGFYIYDIASNTWTAGPPVPGASSRYGCAAGSFSGKVYIAGGSPSASNNVQIYDIASGTWSTGNNAPNGFFLAGYTQVNQNLYVVGGFTTTAGSNLNTTQILDLATGAWSTGPTFTPAKADFALAYFNNRLYAIGGDANGGAYFDSTTAVDVFNGGSWTSLGSPLPSPRQGNQAGYTSTGLAGGEIWSTGGINGSTFAFLNEHIYLPLTTTAATVTVSGRLLSSSGDSISRGLVTYSGSDGVVHSTRTNSFGYFTFTDVVAGETYIFNASAKGYSFAPRVMTVRDELTGFDFIAQ